MRNINNNCRNAVSVHCAGAVNQTISLNRSFIPSPCSSENKNKKKKFATTPFTHKTEMDENVTAAHCP